MERSKNWVVKQALSAWLDQEEERSRLTREALLDVDAGRLIGQQAVRAWAASLDTRAVAGAALMELQQGGLRLGSAVWLLAVVNRAAAARTVQQLDAAKSSSNPMITIAKAIPQL